MVIEFDEYIKNKIRSEMKVRATTTQKMCALLDERLGIKLQPQSFNNKISRSNFNATFFFQCMYALNVKNINLDLNDIDTRIKYEKD